MKALSVLGLSNDQVLLVVDFYANDVFGARAAEIPVLLINRKHKVLKETDVKPEYVAPDLWGVTECINYYDFTH
jgi:FMN phosphatase YigB (HAD superfamily)